MDQDPVQERMEKAIDELNAGGKPLEIGAVKAIVPGTDTPIPGTAPKRRGRPRKVAE